MVSAVPGNDDDRNDNDVEDDVDAISFVLISNIVSFRIFFNNTVTAANVANRQIGSLMTLFIYSSTTEL